MEPIPVKPHPFRQTFDTIDGAVAHAMNHPRRANAEADAAKLEDATLVNGYWSLADWLFEFSNGQWLHITVTDSCPTWQLSPEQPAIINSLPCRVGAKPVYLDWQNFIGVWPMDASELVAKRIGATLTKLFINHTGFFVYFRGHLVFQFHAAYRTDTGEDILYVIEDD